MGNGLELFVLENPSVPLSEQLEGYKNKQISSLFSSSETNSGIGSSIKQGWTYANDVTCFKTYRKIRAVTADDVIKVFNKYWKSDNPARWIIVTGWKF